MNINKIDYRSKYLKYKAKYLLLKELEGGGDEEEEAAAAEVAEKTEAKIPKDIARAASGINVRELLSLKPFLEKLDDLAQARKQEAQTAVAKARTVAAASSAAVSAITQVESNPTSKNLEIAKQAVINAGVDAGVVNQAVIDSGVIKQTITDARVSLKKKAEEKIVSGSDRELMVEQILEKEKRNGAQRSDQIGQASSKTAQQTSEQTVDTSNFSER
jgi:hypothetical protein